MIAFWIANVDIETVYQIIWTVSPQRSGFLVYTFGFESDVM